MMILFAWIPTLLVTTYVPEISLWLPNALLGPCLLRLGITSSPTGDFVRAGKRNVRELNTSDSKISFGVVALGIYQASAKRPP